MKWPTDSARSVWRSALLAAAVFAVVLLVRLPAAFVTLFLPNEIQLRDVQGFLWHGRASAVGVNGVLVQEQLAWRFQPRALLGGSLAWTIDGRLWEQTSRLQLTLRPRGVELSGVSLALPLEPLANLDPRLKPAQLGAMLRVSAPRLNAWEPLTASVAVDHLFTALVPQGEVGNYRIDCKSEGKGRGGWQLTTVTGVLKVLGQGAFDLEQFKINGRLTLNPQSPLPGLSPLLTSLPKVGEDFVVTF